MKINNQVISLFNSNFFIKEDDIVFLVFEICSKLNYKKLIDSYAKEGRPSALPINVMFMVVVYAYINGIYSSRKIEYACKTHICFLWLLQQYEAPSKSTIVPSPKKQTKNLREKPNEKNDKYNIKLLYPTAFIPRFA